MTAQSTSEEDLAEERYYKEIRDTSMVNGPTFLYLQTLYPTPSQEDHFYKLLGNASALPLSAEEFNTQCKNVSTVFKIACKSLKRFKADLIGFSVDLKFDKRYNLTNGNWSRIQKKKKKELNIVESS